MTPLLPRFMLSLFPTFPITDRKEPRRSRHPCSPLFFFSFETELIRQPATRFSARELNTRDSGIYGHSARNDGTYRGTYVYIVRHRVTRGNDEDHLVALLAEAAAASPPAAYTIGWILQQRSTQFHRLVYTRRSLRLFLSLYFLSILSSTLAHARLAVSFPDGECSHPLISALSQLAH